MMIKKDNNKEYYDVYLVLLYKNSIYLPVRSLIYPYILFLNQMYFNKIE